MVSHSTTFLLYTIEKSTKRKTSIVHIFLNVRAVVLSPSLIVVYLEL